MNFVMQSLGNSTENLTLSNKFAYKEDGNDAATTALAIVVSFTAMVVGAGIMLCFVGKLLSKWYTVDNAINATYVSTKPKYTEVESHEETESAASGVGDPKYYSKNPGMKMKPIGSGLNRGISNLNMHKYKIRC